MTNKIFCKNYQGMSAEKIYEDEKVLAFMDIILRSPGHFLVIPKASARNILILIMKVMCSY